MYRGLLPVLSSLYCSNFVYFYTFNGLKAAYISKNSPETAMVDLLFGFLAGENELTVIFQRRDRGLHRDFRVRAHFEKASNRAAFLMQADFGIIVDRFKAKT